MLGRFECVEKDKGAISSPHGEGINLSSINGERGRRARRSTSSKCTMFWIGSSPQLPRTTCTAAAAVSGLRITTEIRQFGRRQIEARFDPLVEQHCHSTATECGVALARRPSSTKTESSPCKSPPAPRYRRQRRTLAESSASEQWSPTAQALDWRERNSRPSRRLKTDRNSTPILAARRVLVSPRLRRAQVRRVGLKHQRLSCLPLHIDIEIRADGRHDFNLGAVQRDRWQHDAFLPARDPPVRGNLRRQGQFATHL